MKKAKTVELAPPAGAEAALYFLDGQLVFQEAAKSGLTTKLVSSATARQAFSKTPIDSGWLPAGVARWGVGSKGMWMVRWHAPRIYEVTLDEGKQRKIRVPMPALLWFGQKHNYFIWAVAGSKFDPKAVLYRAPLPNVNSTGLICFGNNQHPDVSKGGFDAAWKTFWRAPFNNHQDDGKSRAFPRSVNDQLRKLARERAKSYPLKDLMTAGGNLNATIERFTRRGDDSAGVGFYDPDADFAGWDEEEEEFDE